MATSTGKESRIQTVKSSRSAKRSTLACTGCKRTKRRCDLAQQSHDSDGCTNCKEKGEYCEVRYGDDRRRKRRDSAATEIQSRLSALEDLITLSSDSRNSLIDASSAERSRHLVSSDDPLQSLDESNGTPVDLFNTDRRMERSRYCRVATSNSTAADGSLPLSQSRNRPIRDVLLDPSQSTQFSSRSGPSPEVETARTQASATSPSKEFNAIMGRVIARESGLEGQSRENREYFGATSIYHLSGDAQDDQEKQQNSEMSLCLNSNFENIEIPPELDSSNEPEPIVTHLLDLFWKWQAPHLQILHKTLFIADKQLYDTELRHRKHNFFSPVLLYAVLSLASMISPDRGVRRYSSRPGGVPGDVFFEKAKKMFDEEMRDPSITTVQTALVLGSRYGALGQNSLGWSYSGIAIRMAVEIGLHLSCDKAVTSNKISLDMAEVRRLVFWGCYVQDKLWSAYCGRPSLLMDWDITVGLPKESECLTGSQNDPTVISAAVHQHIVLLTTMCSKILCELYSQKNGCNLQHLRSVANAIHADLFHWHRDLPAPLKWPNNDDAPGSPHVLLMHMQFYFTLLLLHRPFIDFDGVVATISHLDEVPGCAITICTLAATNIAKLTRDYSLFYNLKQVPSPAIHFIFTAATIHLINHTITHDDQSCYLFHGCLSGLALIADAYPIAHKAVSVLQNLLQRLNRGQLHEIDAALRSSFPNAGESTVGIDESNESLLSRGVAKAGATDLAEDFRSQRNRGASATRNPGSGTNPSFRVDSQQASLVELGNFDWSTYNSPIALPPDLINVDLDVYSFPMESSSVIDPGVQMPSAFTFPRASVIDGLSNDIGQNVSNILGSGTEVDNTFFNRFYGTAFGLN